MPLATLTVPTPVAGRGNVHGSIAVSMSVMPLETAELYLADIHASPTGQFSSYYFDRQVNPKAQWMAKGSGEFLFEGVRPGRYVLMLWWDFDSFVAVQSGKEKGSVEVEVIGGQISDLGLIEIGQQ
jgi:hypothetical protein